MIFRWMRLASLLSIIFCVAFARAQENPDIARDARVTSSDETIDHPAKMAVDGSNDTEWEASGSPEAPSWIVL